MSGHGFGTMIDVSGWQCQRANGFISGNPRCHYNDVMISAMASQITSLTIVYSAVYSGTDQRKLGLCEGNSPHKGPATLKLFPFDDVIMVAEYFNRLGSCLNVNLNANCQVMCIFTLEVPQNFVRHFELCYVLTKYESKSPISKEH